MAQEQIFIATLAGQEEVRPTDSQTSGTAEFTITGGNAGYRVIASDIQDVTAGQSTVVISVTLFQNDSPTNEVLETGSITADNLEGLMAGKQLTALVTAMSNGETYVNIYTDQNPNGK